MLKPGAAVELPVASKPPQEKRPKPAPRQRGRESDPVVSDSGRTMTPAGLEIAETAASVPAEPATDQPASAPTESGPHATATQSPEEQEDESFDIGPQPGDDLRASYQRLGAEGLARLRTRFAEVSARINERQMDDVAREELKARAERLNPDAWVTADEVSAGLEQYETVYESLRAVVGQRRKRRRRR